MEEQKEPIVTVNKVLGIIIAVFSFLAVLSLIWAQWRAFQSCLTVILFGVLAVLFIPDDK